MSCKTLADGIHHFTCFPSFVRAGFSSREFPRARYEDFLTGLSLKMDDLVMVEQVHGREIFVAEAPTRGRMEVEADGLVTDRVGLVLGIRTADCVPIFFSSERTRSIGMVHGGRKGIRAGIISQVIQVMRNRYRADPSELIVAIGPCIRQCCYEVGEETLDGFSGFYHSVDRGKAYLDLVGKVGAELVGSGVAPNRIYDCEICTACRNDSFYSYRRERGTSERILNVISLVG
ncbi:MAG TPA: polyphenol oxidase family protein [Candidatus Omnitrophota bacterium]|nr:polyphenol oxidase family protein [Candidatus Omnitrophota bacterium]